MAEAEDLDLATSSPKTNKKNRVIYFIIGLLIIGLGVTSLMLYMSKDKDDSVEEEVEEEEVVVDRSHKFYLPIDTLTVNFNTSGRIRYLQIDLQLMTHEESVVDAVEMHMPVIRNDTLLIIGNKDMTSLNSMEGKEKLAEEILQAVQKILVQQGVEGAVEAVYFTNFVMQ